MRRSALEGDVGKGNNQPIHNRGGSAVGSCYTVVFTLQIEHYLILRFLSKLSRYPQDFLAGALASRDGKSSDVAMEALVEHTHVV